MARRQFRIVGIIGWRFSRCLSSLQRPSSDGVIDLRTTDCALSVIVTLVTRHRRKLEASPSVFLSQADFILAVLQAAVPAISPEFSQTGPRALPLFNLLTERLSYQAQTRFRI